MAYDFGVTATEVCDMIEGFEASASTTPSTSRVEGWIATHTAIVAGVFVSKGVSPDGLDTDGTGYAYGHQTVLTRAVAQLAFAVQGRQDQAVELRREADDMMQRLREWVHELGSDASASDGAVDMIDRTMSTTRRAIRQARTTSVRGRMINGRTL